jgi:hypothetical protein
MENDPRFTDKSENPSGLHRRYFIQKADGSPVSPEAEYFVLRLDSACKDSRHREACLKAILLYAHRFQTTCQSLRRIYVVATDTRHNMR